jgi:DNA-binding NtrC family response regulator
MAKIVLIDDEAPMLDLMTKVCRKLGHEAFAYQTGREGVSAIPSIQPQLVIVDLRIGDMNGLQIIEKCRRDYPATNVVMVTGFGTVETAVEAMKLGAFDYLTKPFELEDLQRIIHRAVPALEAAPQAAVVNMSTAAIAEALDLPSGPVLIGNSPQIKEILRLVEKVANIDSPILLEGEFGSGKQMLARTIHDRSRRRDQMFKVLHTGALPAELLEQELFGANGGQSIFNRAAGGTVVIDEIHHLPLRLQSQLDTFLETINTKRQRGSLPASQDVRVIATSSEPLDKLIKEGKFREDLFYRLSVIPIHLPPLRQRRDDIELLAMHFLSNYSRWTGSQVNGVDRYAMDLLKGYSWPGNVGELQNAIERACAFAEGRKIRPTDLPPKITQKIEVSDQDAEGAKHQLPIGRSLDDYIRNQERMFIRETLKFNEGSREKTASMLGVSIATLYRKMGLKLEREKMLQ